MPNPFEKFGYAEELPAPEKNKTDANPFEAFGYDDTPSFGDFEQLTQPGELPAEPHPDAAAWKKDFEPKRTWGQAVIDSAIGFNKGLASVADSVANTGDFVNDALHGPGVVWKDGSYMPQLVEHEEYNRLRNQGMSTPADATGAAVDYFEGLKSPAIRNDAKHVANADGYVDTVKRLWDRPAAIGNAIADSFAFAIPGFAAARAARAAGLGAKGIAGATAATGAVLEGGGARAEAVDDVMSLPLATLIERSPDFNAYVQANLKDPNDQAARLKVEDEARRKVAADAGFTAQALTMPVSFLASKLTGAAKAEADFFTGEGVKGFFRGLGGQFIEETAQEAGTQAAVNAGVRQNADSGRDYTQGLGNAAAMGGIVGASQQVGMSTGKVAADAYSRLRNGGQLPQNSMEEAFLQQQEQQPQEQQAEPLGLGYNPRRMITMPDGTTAWEDQLAPTETPAAARQHPGYAELNKTADDLEAELGQGESVEDQLAKLEADLRLIPYEPTPVQNWTAATAPSQDFGNGIDFEAPGLPGQQPELALADYGGGIDYVPQTVSRVDALAGGVENAMADYAKSQRLAGLPPGFDDPRLARDEFRQSIEGLVNTLEKGGGISYLRDENDVITGRTQSVNPEWFQAMAKDSTTAMSVEDTRAAVAKALKGERLGVRQTRVVKSLLDEVSGIRSNYAGVLRDNRKQVAQERAKAFWDAVPNDGQDDYGLVQESIAERFNEANYLPEASYDDRATAELADQAMGLGASWDDIDAAIASGNGQESTKALGRLIYGLRNEHRKNTTAGQPAAGAGGIPGDVRPRDSSAPAESLAKRAADPSQAGQADQPGIAPSADAVAAIANESPSSPLNDLPEPTEAQKEAGNYRKPVVRLHGLDIAIENPKGSVRRGVDPNGKAWESPMHAHYGYVKRSQGADGDAVDVFVGDKPDSQTVFVIDQQNADGTFDEHKVVMGTNTMLEAKVLYKKNYQKGWQVGPATAMSVDEFKAWLKNGDTTQPLQPDQFAKAGEKTGQKPNLDNQKPNLDNSLSKSDGDLLTKELKRLVESGDFETDGSRAAAYAKRIQKARDGDASALAWAKDWLSKLDGATNLDNELTGQQPTNTSNVKEENSSQNLPGENPERLAAFARGEIPPNTTEKYAEWVKSLPAGERAEMFSSRVTPTSRNAQYMAWAGLRKPSEKAPEREEVKTYGGSLFDSPKFSVADGDAAFKPVGSENYGRDLDESLKSLKSVVPPIRLGKTPDVLRALGAPDLDLYIRRDTVRKATNGAKEGHDVPLDVIRDLPALLSDPVAVFGSASPTLKDGERGLVVVVDAKTQAGKPVMAALHLGVTEGRLEVNRIASAYGKDRYSTMDLRYLNPQKSPDLVRLVRVQFPLSGSPNQGSFKKVMGPQDIVKPDKLSVGAGVDTGGVTKADVEPVIARIAKSFGGRKINVMAIDSLVELPPEVKAGVEADGVDQSKVRGIFHGGKIFINLAALNTPEDIERVILHELAHDGLAKMFGPEIQRAMGGLYLAIGGDKTLRALATKHAMPLARYEQAYANASPGARIALMTEELLAHIAQDSRPTVMRKLKELVGAIRLWLREHGFLKSADVSESELFALLKEVRQYSGGDGDVRYSLEQGSTRFSEDNRLSNLSPQGANWQRIRDNNPALAKVTDFDQEVTVYRATVGDSIRPDDFVAVDKKIAQTELKNVKARDGKGKIIEQKVKVRDLLMANDATEFVYFPEQTEQLNQSAQSLPDTINVNGKERPTTNSNGQPIAATEEAVRNFWEWFGDSKVVDEQGRPLVVYHGTTASFDVFDPARSKTTGVFFSAKPDYANIVAELDGARKGNANVMPAYVSIGNPMFVKSRDFSRLDTKKALTEGFDGLITLDDEGQASQITAFRSEQIKSATGNKGTFDPDDPDIRFSLDPNETTRPRGGFSASGLAKKAADVFKTSAEKEADLRRENLAPEIRGGIEALGDSRTMLQKAISEIKRQLKPGGLLPGNIFKLKIERDGEFNAHELEASVRVQALHDAVEAAFKKPYEELHPEIKARINSALRGEPQTKPLPKEIGDALAKMREHITRLSVAHLEQLHADAKRLIEEGDEPAADAKARLIETIMGNLDTYLHRSYKAFDDPDWPNKVRRLHPEIYEAAVTYLAKGYADGEAPGAEHFELARKKANLMLEEGTAFDSVGAFIAESKLGAKDLGIIKKRKDIAPEIRALLGEYEDAPVNYVKSATKMTRLVFNHAFLTKMREAGFAAGLFSQARNTNLDHNKQIAGEASEVYAPLNGLYTSHEFHQALVDALGREQMAWWYRAIVTANGLVKYGKTVLSPTTAMRNFYSAMFFSLANGHFNFGHGKRFSWSTYFKSQDTGLEYFAKLRRLGVVYDSPYAGEMMALLKDSRLDETVFNWKPFKWGRAAVDFAQRFYGFGDDLWKIIGFENEKRLLLSARPGLTEEAAEKEAAERIRNTYPTYSMTPRFINSLRRFPLMGTFVSFPAEIIRTSYHIVNNYARDVRDYGFKSRLVQQKTLGLIIATSAMAAIQAISRAIAGVDDDEEEALRLLSPEWQKNSNLMYLGRDKNGALQTMDMSFLDPYGYWKRPINAVLQNQPLDEAIKSGARDVLAPFFGQGIAFGAIMDAAMNKKDSGGRVFNPEDDAARQAWDIAGHIGKAVQPGVINNITRLHDAAVGRVTASGRRFDVGDELAGLVGFRWGTFEPRTALYYQTFGFLDRKRDSAKLLTEAMRDPNKVTDEELREAFDRSMKARERAYNDIIKVANAAKASGMSVLQVQLTLKNSGVSQDDARDIARGKVPAWRYTKGSGRGAIKKAQVLFDKEVADEFKRREAFVRGLKD